MSNEKEFGKLTPDQFRRLVKTLQELRKQGGELADFMRGNPKRLGDFLGPNDHQLYRVSVICFVAPGIAVSPAPTFQARTKATMLEFDWATLPQ